jgi:hypothetical protein
MVSAKDFFGSTPSFNGILSIYLPDAINPFRIVTFSVKSSSGLEQFDMMLQINCLRVFYLKVMPLSLSLGSFGMSQDRNESVDLD